MILSLARYERLIEDLHDLAVGAERRGEKPIHFEEMKRQLKKNGILQCCVEECHPNLKQHLGEIHV